MHENSKRKKMDLNDVHSENLSLGWWEASVHINPFQTYQHSDSVKQKPA